MIAVYISATQFSVAGNLTGEFTTGRRIKADCGVDGYQYSTIQSSSYSSNTTVTITESVLTSNLADVLYGIVNIGAEGSFPDHTHDGTEGQGGSLPYVIESEFTTYSGAVQIQITTLSGVMQTQIEDKPDAFTELFDTPSSYSNGLFAKSTDLGIVWATVSSGTSDVQTFLDLIDTPTTYSGHEGEFLIATNSGIEFIDSSILIDSSMLFEIDEYGGLMPTSTSGLGSSTVVSIKEDLSGGLVTEIWSKNTGDLFPEFMDDTYIEEYHPDNNYNNTSTVIFNRTSDVYNYDKSALFKFHIKECIGSKNITSAIFKFYCTDDSWTSTPLYRVLKSWEPTEVTWNIYKTGSAWTSAGCNAGTSFPVDDSPTADYYNTPICTLAPPVINTWRPMDITSIVQAWSTNVHKEYGIILLGNSSTSAVAAAYSNEGIDGFRPTLEISYYADAKVDIDTLVDGQMAVTVDEYYNKYTLNKLLAKWIVNDGNKYTLTSDLPTASAFIINVSTRVYDIEATSWKEWNGNSWEIVSMIGTFIDLIDTPNLYSEGLYAKSTASGIVWATVSGGSSSVQTFLDLIDTPNSYSNGLYPKSTTSGIVWGTSSPSTGLWDFGESTLSGTGDICCNDLYLDDIRISVENTTLLANMPAIPAYGIDEYTVLMLHMDGDNGSTSIIDSSSYNHTTASVTGSIHLDTGQYKFGVSSLSGDGATGHITIPDSTDWYFGTGDLTIDFWFKPNTLSNSDGMTIMSQRDSSKVCPILIMMQTATYGNKYTVLTSNYWGETGMFQSTTTPSTSRWDHVALVRYNGTFKLYINGISEATRFNNVDLPNFSDTLQIGGAAFSESYTMNAHLDEFRISKGIARWIENFTPPNRPYEESRISFSKELSYTDHIHNFLDLTDTPSTYSGTSGMFAQSTGSGIAWTTISGLEGPAGVDGTAFITSSGIPSISTGNFGDSYLDIETNNIYKKNIPTYGLIDLFTGGTPSASSVFVGSYPATYAVDNNMGTAWFASTTANEWWKYDFGLGKEKTISKIRVYPRADGSRNFKDYQIHGSNNNSDWTLLRSGTIPDGTPAWENIEFSNSTPYRYIRITVLNTYTNYCGIIEVEAFDVSGFDWGLVGNIEGDVGSTTFLDLVDTPNTYSEGKFAQSTGSGIVWATVSGGSGASSFIELTDTPSSYSNGKFAQSTEDGIVWTTVSGGGTGASYGELELSYSSNIVLDFTTYNLQSVILTGTTNFTFTNMTNGKPCILNVIQDAQGSRAATFQSNIKWSQGVIPTTSSGSGLNDIFTFVQSRGTIYGDCSKAFQLGS